LAGPPNEALAYRAARQYAQNFQMPEPIRIPTALTPRETAALQHLAAGKRVVEAGSLLGYSTVAMGQVARQVVAIDPHDGYPIWQPRPTLEVFERNIREHGVGERVTAIVGFGEDHLPLYAADVAFLDLTGHYDVTLRCIEGARAPIICCHDYMRGGCHGATEAVDYFARRGGHTVRTVDTLAVIETK
jgi:predicted O-methyltransferase YrrM